MKATRRACAAAPGTSATTRSTTSRTPPVERSTSARSATGRFVWAVRSSVGRHGDGVHADATRLTVRIPQVGPAHDGNCAYVMQQEAARKAHQEKYDKWSIENAQADEKFNEMLKKERAGGQTKPCPKCKQAITKNHGCDHMTCNQRLARLFRSIELDVGLIAPMDSHTGAPAATSSTGRRGSPTARGSVVCSRAGAAAAAPTTDSRVKCDVSHGILS